MARARNIKPGFAKNEDLAECSVWARLCFALLPTLADREGRLEDRPKRIKGELFAFDSIEVEPMLAELAHHGFIERYVIDGRGLIQIIAFHKHQNPHHREPESALPPHPSLRLDADGKWIKPEALIASNDDQASGNGALHEPKAPDKPEASPGLDPPRSDLPPPLSRVDSGNSDSGSIPPIPPTGGKASLGLKAWMAMVKAKGEKAIPEGDEVFAYADSVGIPAEFLALAWREFVHRYSQPDAKRYSNWRLVFRKAVRSNWLKLWWLDGQQYALTTAGIQAQRAHSKEAA